MAGWIAVKRGITQHPIFHKRPDRAYVWLWMLETAAWKDTRQDAGGRPVEVKRGQVLTSLRQMSSATGVGVQAIRTLLGLLRDECAINTDTDTGRMLITICNYEKYQSYDGRSNSVSNTEPTQSQHTKRTREQDIPLDTDVSNGRGASEDSSEIDPVKMLFDAGVSLLGRSGVKAGNARSLIGKWRKDAGDEAVIAAIGRASREAATEPVAFIEGCLRASKKTQKPQYGDVRQLPDGRWQSYDPAMGGWVAYHVLP